MEFSIRRLRRRRTLFRIMLFGGIPLIVAFVAFVAFVSFINDRVAREEKFEARLQAEYAALEAQRDITEECWGEGRNLEEFTTGPVFTSLVRRTFGRRSLGSASLPSEASTVGVMNEYTRPVATYERGGEARNFYIDLCFLSLEEPKAMVFRLTENAPLTIGINEMTNRPDEDAVWFEALLFTGWLEQGHSPLEFKPTAERVSIRMLTDESLD